MTQEPIGRAGMGGPGVEVRQGPICRTVEDAAKVLGAVVGYDAKDPKTAFSIDRLPEQPLASYAKAGSLTGLRIGVIREYMDARLFSKRDEEAIGFPAITVPAGFTSQVYDREPDPSSPDDTRLVGPVAARLPIGADFAARPFGEPLLVRIAAAFEAATKHRDPPPAFKGLPAAAKK